MKKIIKSTLIALGFAMLTVVPAGATTNSDLFSACDASKTATTSPVCNPVKPTNPVNETIKVAADIVAIITGVAAVIVIIVGGITLISSGGNPEAVANARKRITAALIGLVIVSLAWTLVAFVTDKFIK